MVKKSGFLFWLFLTLLICYPALAAEDYELTAGDCLNISVFGYPELQVQQLEIRTDGKISFPLVGEVQAAGMTTAKLGADITHAIAEYVKNPQVTVNVAKFHTIRVYVLGEVVRPGLYEINKQHNLLDAVSLAGGYTTNTNKKSVYVVQKATGQCLQVDLDNLLKKGDLSQNYALGDGDVVYLGRNGLSFIKDILPIITGVKDIRDLLRP